MNTYYDSIKPSFGPPSWIFAPVWTVLYVLMTITFSFVFSKTFNGVWPVWIAIPFIINLISNILYSPIQFGARNTKLAKADIIIVLASLIVGMIAVFPYSQVISFALIPYLAWLLFATVLQFSLIND